MSDLISRTDMLGSRFGRLTVIRETGSRTFPSGSKAVMWECKCECGNLIMVQGRHLRSGNTQSCGCFRNQRVAQTHYVHGDAKRDDESRLYTVWRSMIARCENPNNKRYSRYGGRGIAVCAAWKIDYRCFKDWAIKHGYDPLAAFGECTIDRINNDGNYDPSNCRWTDMKTQSKNRGAKHAG